MKTLAAFAVLAGSIVCAGPQGVAQQAAAASLPSQASRPSQASLPSQTLRPALDLLGRDLATLDASRWKLNTTVRGQTASDLDSLKRDLDKTLPPLLATADAAPQTPSALLPVSRNITALYDVLVRLVERGRAAAPQDQEGTLEQARESLDTARRAFDDDLQTDAAAQDARIAQLMRPATPPPAPPPPAPTNKKKAKSKPSA